MTRRGVVRKRWDQKGRPWYVVCFCCPGKLYRIGPASQDLQEAREQAVRCGWIYDVATGWSCPECSRVSVNDQLGLCLAKPVVPTTNKKKDRGGK